MKETEDQEREIKARMDMEKKRQALADFLKIDPREISACSTRVNDLTTFQAKMALYLIGTEEEVNAGIRGYFEHNLSELDSAFIGSTAKLSDRDSQMVDRLCEIMAEDIETQVLDKALLNIVKKCGDVNKLIETAVAEVERGEFLAVDGKEHNFGSYLVYKFRDGQCSDYDF